MVWKDHPELHNDFKKATVFSPSMPFEYCPRMIALGKVLSDKASFKLGEDPKVRAKRRGKIEGEKFAFWDYPVRVLVHFNHYNDSK